LKIDFHCHLFHEITSVKKDNPAKDNYQSFKGYSFQERFLKGLEGIKSINAGNIFEKTLFHVNNASFDKIVLLPVTLKENQEVKEWVNFAPDIFIPFYNPPEKSDNKTEVKETIEKALTEYDYKGLKILLTFRKKKLNDPILYPILEIAQDRNLPVVMHCGYPPPGTRKNVLTYSNPIFIDEIINSFPKAKVIITHMGYPFTDIAIALATQYPNIYLDISNLTIMMPLRLKELLLQAKEIIGVNKILYGSDSSIPQSIELAVKYFDNIDFLTKIEVQKILGLNAAKILDV